MEWVIVIHVLYHGWASSSCLGYAVSAFNGDELMMMGRRYVLLKSEAKQNVRCCAKKQKKRSLAVLVTACMRRPKMGSAGLPVRPVPSHPLAGQPPAEIRRGQHNIGLLVDLIPHSHLSAGLLEILLFLCEILFSLFFQTL